MTRELHAIASQAGVLVGIIEEEDLSQPAPSFADDKPWRLASVGIDTSTRKGEKK